MPPRTIATGLNGSQHFSYTIKYLIHLIFTSPGPGGPESTYGVDQGLRVLADSNKLYLSISIPRNGSGFGSDFHDFGLTRPIAQRSYI